jgi:membrane protein DedA with SNARE-associated domain
MPGFDELIQLITDYPYIGVAAMFLLCGLGLPLPEELVLLAAGFVCAKYPENAKLLPMIGWCATAILVGDMIPFLLGRTFGVRLLRLRWLRILITKQRLAMFDRWFRRRGDMVIVISRFLAGLRMVAFFTAGAMKMRWSRFLLLDGLGIILIAPLLTWLGFSSAGFIEDMIERIEKVERGLLWGVIGGTLLLAAGLWLQRRRRQQKRRSQMTEEFVQPQKRINEAEDAGELAAATSSETLKSNELILEPRPDADGSQCDEENGPKTKPDKGGPTGENGEPVNP